MEYIIQHCKRVGLIRARIQQTVGFCRFGWEILKKYKDRDNFPIRYGATHEPNQERSETETDKKRFAFCAFFLLPAKPTKYQQLVALCSNFTKTDPFTVLNSSIYSIFHDCNFIEVQFTN
jgi:hypothetical protein